MECEDENSKCQDFNISETTIRSSHQGFSEKKPVGKLLQSSRILPDKEMLQWDPFSVTQYAQTLLLHQI